MEPAERIESGTALGKRPRSRALPRTPSMVTVPSAAKQGRQERRAASLPAAGTGTGAAGAMPVGYCYYYGGSFAAVETAAFLKACGRCSRRLGPGHDTFIYRLLQSVRPSFHAAFTWDCNFSTLELGGLLRSLPVYRITVLRVQVLRFLLRIN